MYFQKMIYNFLIALITYTGYIKSPETIKYIENKAFLRKTDL